MNLKYLIYISPRISENPFHRPYNKWLPQTRCSHLVERTNSNMSADHFLGWARSSWGQKTLSPPPPRYPKSNGIITEVCWALCALWQIHTMNFSWILKVWHYYITAHSPHACLQTFGSSLGRKNSLELQQRYSRVVQCLLEYDNFLYIGFIPYTPTPDILYWGNRSKLLLSYKKEAWCILLIKYYIHNHSLASTISFWSEITKSTNDFFFFLFFYLL